MNKGYIALGSNMGDRERYLQQAIDFLAEHEAIDVLDQSDIYETPPVGYTEQGAFLNMAIAVETTLEAHALLTIMQAVETRLGRTREIHWGPRTIDLDILLFNNDNIESETLQVPHPRMHERAFVLVPLADIASEALLTTGRTVAAELEQLADRADVKRWATTLL